jgi:hypothetical protein
MADTVYQKAARAIDAQLVEPLRYMLQARKLFAKQIVLPAGKYEIDWKKITEMGAANISYGLPQGDLERDMVKLTGEQLKTAFVFKGFMVQRQDFDAFKNDGIQLDATGAESAGAVVAEREEDFLTMGWKRDGTLYEKPGLYNTPSCSTEGSALVTSTFGNAVKKLKLARIVLKAAKIYGVNFNWALASNNYEEVLGSIDTTVGMQREIVQVREMLNPIPGMPIGDLVECPKLTADTGMLIPVDPSGRFLDLIIGQNPRTYFGFDSRLGEEASPIYGHVIEALVPRVKVPTAICTTTGL